MQLGELREYCSRREWQVAGEYVDRGISGSKERRPELDRLLSDCRKRRVDAVVVYRYDRFARSLRQLVNALDEFRSLGIQFVSLHEGVNTSTPNGRLVFGIFASIAEFERELIHDRVRSGLAAARAGEYVDRGVSGSKDSRPELNRLMADAHKRKFDIVCVWKFDRFARSVSHLLRALETFKALGIEFCSYSEQLDTSTPAGKMVFTVLGAVAELERSLVVERVRAGLRNARAKGKQLGRPRVVLDPAKVDALRAQGLSWRAIARELGCATETARLAVRLKNLSKSDSVSPLICAAVSAPSGVQQAFVSCTRQE